MAYWICQLLGWGLNTFGQGLTALSNELPAPTWRILLEVTLINGLGLVLTHFLRQYIKRHEWPMSSIGALLPRVVVGSVAVGFPLAAVMSFLSIGMLWGGGPPEKQEAMVELGGDVIAWLIYTAPLLLRTLNWSVIIALWLVMYFSITSVRDRRLAALRQKELAHALQAAELRLLKSQLNPHFLFNSLNSVRALIADDPTGAQKAVTQLARTLRYTLTAGQEEVVSLERELEIVADYLELESLRLGERLRIERTISVDARVARIPVMLLQTVVENAIKHGIAELPQGGVLRVSAEVRDALLLIEVENPRPATPLQVASHGIGLRNAIERLRLLFGKAAGLDLDLSRPDVALARIRIPQADEGTSP
jgi:Histidine kinase